MSTPRRGSGRILKKAATPASSGKKPRRRDSGRKGRKPFILEDFVLSELTPENVDLALHFLYEWDMQNVQFSNSKSYEENCSHYEETQCSAVSTCAWTQGIVYRGTCAVNIELLKTTLRTLKEKEGKVVPLGVNGEHLPVRQMLKEVAKGDEKLVQAAEKLIGKHDSGEFSYCDMLAMIYYGAPRLSLAHEDKLMFPMPPQNFDTRIKHVWNWKNSAHFRFPLYVRIADADMKHKQKRTTTKPMPWNLLTRVVGSGLVGPPYSGNAEGEGMNVSHHDPLPFNIPSGSVGPSELAAVGLHGGNAGAEKGKYKMDLPLQWEKDEGKRSDYLSVVEPDNKVSITEHWLEYWKYISSLTVHDEKLGERSVLSNMFSTTDANHHFLSSNAQQNAIGRHVGTFMAKMVKLIEKRVEPGTTLTVGKGQWNEFQEEARKEIWDEFINDYNAKAKNIDDTIDMYAEATKIKSGDVALYKKAHKAALARVVMSSLIAADPKITILKVAQVDTKGEKLAEGLTRALTTMATEMAKSQEKKIVATAVEAKVQPFDLSDVVTDYNKEIEALVDHVKTKNKKMYESLLVDTRNPQGESSFENLANLIQIDPYKSLKRIEDQVELGKIEQDPFKMIIDMWKKSFAETSSTRDQGAQHHWGGEAATSRKMLVRGETMRRVAKEIQTNLYKENKSYLGTYYGSHIKDILTKSAQELLGSACDNILNEHGLKDMEQPYNNVAGSVAGTCDFVEEDWKHFYKATLKPLIEKESSHTTFWFYDHANRARAEWQIPVLGLPKPAAKKGGWYNEIIYHTPAVLGTIAIAGALYGASSLVASSSAGAATQTAIVDAGVSAFGEHGITPGTQLIPIGSALWAYNDGTGALGGVKSFKGVSTGKSKGMGQILLSKTSTVKGIIKKMITEGMLKPGEGEEAMTKYISNLKGFTVPLSQTIKEQQAWLTKLISRNNLN